MDDQVDFADLIRRIRNGDDAAAAQLVHRYELEIRSEVRARLRFRDARLRRSFDSMDIVQSVLQSFFLRVAVGQYNLDDPGQLLALLVAMARNKLAEQVRFEQRECRDVRRLEGEITPAQSYVQDEPSPSRVISGKDLLQEFRHRLTEEERRLVDLRAEGRTWSELATEIGGTPEGRRKQFSRAVDRVFVELGLDE